MNKQTLIGAVAGAVVVTGVAAVAGYRAVTADEYAQVVSATPVMKTVKTPRQVCRDETVTTQAPVKDKHQVTGSVLGAVVGGVLGSQVGSGSGRTVATVAGAAAGGYAGNRVQENMQEGDTVTTTQQKCETVYDSREEPTGQYAVQYRVGEELRETTLDYNPGERVLMRDGAIAPPAAPAPAAN